MRGAASYWRERNGRGLQEKMASTSPAVNPRFPDQLCWLECCVALGNLEGG
jgi:hypothetical protein